MLIAIEKNIKKNVNNNRDDQFQNCYKQYNDIKYNLYRCKSKVKNKIE